MNITQFEKLADNGEQKAACCGPDGFVAQMKALGHPVRMQIVNQLIDRDRCCCGDFCACMPLAQSTISQHLDMLCKAGLVEYAPDGNRSRYSLNRTAFKALARAMSGIAERGEDGVRQADPRDEALENRIG